MGNLKFQQQNLLTGTRSKVQRGDLNLGPHPSMVHLLSLLQGTRGRRQGISQMSQGDVSGTQIAVGVTSGAARMWVNRRLLFPFSQCLPCPLGPLLPVGVLGTSTPREGKSPTNRKLGRHRIRNQEDSSLRNGTQTSSENPALLSPLQGQTPCWHSKCWLTRSFQSKH